MAGDKTFGLNSRGGEFFLGNASVDFDGDDLIDGNKYKGTKGLWGLITMKKNSPWSCYRRRHEKL